MRGYFLPGLMLVTGLACSLPAFALGGCVDSPENPTLMLGVLGAAAATLPSLQATLRTRLRARFARRDHKQHVV